MGDGQGGEGISCGRWAERRGNILEKLQEESWMDSQESSSLPQPLCSAPHLSQDSFSPNHFCFGFSGLFVLPAPSLLAQKMLLEQPSRSKTCTIPIYSICICLFTHPASYQHPAQTTRFSCLSLGLFPQFRRRSRSSKYPTPPGLPKPQPSQKTPTPKKTTHPGREVPLS